MSEKWEPKLTPNEAATFARMAARERASRGAHFELPGKVAECPGCADLRAKLAQAEAALKEENEKSSREIDRLLKVSTETGVRFSRFRNDVRNLADTYLHHYAEPTTVTALCKRLVELVHEYRKG